MLRRSVARTNRDVRGGGWPAGWAARVADPIKSTTPEAIRALRADGVQIVMLTGDSRTTAEAVARTLGIDHVEAEVLPAQKGDVVRGLQTQGHIVAMAGDGINDAPALAQAQVGIAMGTGTDVAMESAGVTLVQGDLRGSSGRGASARAPCAISARTCSLRFSIMSLGSPSRQGSCIPSWACCSVQ